ncbi:hypothetical protein [Thiomonas intermedia]|uniref:hypothetical protein n=1 Tax=Thiomonas intermedia TaxID=926 RepID=UPI0012ABAAFC|nr:hypothetical protein [Thiomonas intermedia]
MAESNRNPVAPSKDAIHEARSFIANDALYELSLQCGALLKFCHQLDDPHVHELRGIAVRMQQLHDAILNTTVLEGFSEDELESAADKIYGNGWIALDHAETLATIQAAKAAREANHV